MIVQLLLLQQELTILASLSLSLFCPVKANGKSKLGPGDEFSWGKWRKQIDTGPRYHHQQQQQQQQLHNCKSQVY